MNTTSKLGAIALLGVVIGCGGPTGSQASLGSQAPTTSGAPSGDGCTLTQGYWKNHGGWPVTSLTLGSVSYDEAQLRAILGTPVRGNGLLALAHQLIAAKLNLASGAAGAALGSAIADADALIGDLVVPPVGGGRLDTGATSALTETIDQFNNGAIGPGHCDAGPGGGSGGGGGGDGGTCGCGDGSSDEPTDPATFPSPPPSPPIL